VTARQLKAFVTILVETLSTEIRSADDRQRITTRMREIAESVETMLRDAQAAAADLAESPSSAANIDADSEQAEFTGTALLSLHHED
jgi:hypothetical protein